MKERDFDSWGDFIVYAEALIAEAHEQGRLRSWNTPLFRGHSDSSWKLETTLEREGIGERRCYQYDCDIRSASTAISTVASVHLSFEDWKEPEYAWKGVVNYNSMAWFRQNGFPSPLLDWSRSPFVALFFAYNTADVRKAEKVSVYSFIETKNGSRESSRDANSATITTVGEWLSTDKKHYLQQSNYTVSLREESGGYYYSSHEIAMEHEDDGNENQMVMLKCNLPATERDGVMRALRRMNITEYSLFETTEALLRTISNDIFD